MKGCASERARQVGFIRIAILFGWTFLCACTPDAKWDDLTGQGRTDEQRRADYGVCLEKAGARPGVPFSNAIAEALYKCLCERGWRSHSSPECPPKASPVR